MAARRELIEPHKGDKRYVRRNKKGHSRKAMTLAARFPGPPPQSQDRCPKGQGDRGDRWVGR